MTSQRIGQSAVAGGDTIAVLEGSTRHKNYLMGIDTSAFGKGAIFASFTDGALKKSSNF